MELKLDFLKNMQSITLLLMLTKDEMLTVDVITARFGITKRNVNNHIRKLVKLMFVTRNKNTIKLTPRGQYVATLLNNINFYLGGSV